MHVAIVHKVHVLVETSKKIMLLALILTVSENPVKAYMLYMNTGKHL